MSFFSVLLAILSGCLVLLGYWLPVLQPLQNILIRWAMLLAGVAAFLGIFGLVSVHADKIRRRESNSLYSALLLISLVAVFLFSLVLGVNHPGMRILLNGVILPVEAALMALLAISLVYAAIRLLRRRTNLMAIIFIVTVLFIIFGSATLPFGDVPLLGGFVNPWLSQVLAVGGARGILIGVALGTLTTGLRILFGVDRPYGGS